MPTPFVPAPGVVSVDAIFLQDNQKVENTYHYHVSGTIDQAKLQGIATTYFSWMNARLGDWPTNVECISIYLRDLTTANSATAEGTPLTALIGTKTGAALPNNVTIALKRQTGLAGRANRGRLYWVGLTASDVSDANHIANSRVNQMRDALNTLMTAQVTDNAAQEVILHKKLGTYTPILGYTYSDLTLDAMRRRLPDHNRHR